MSSVFSTRKTNIANNTNNPTARYKNSITLLPYFRKLINKLLVIVYNSKLVFTFPIFF